MQVIEKIESAFVPAITILVVAGAIGGFLAISMVMSSTTVTASDSAGLSPVLAENRDEILRQAIEKCGGDQVCLDNVEATTDQMLAFLDEP